MSLTPARRRRIDRLVAAVLALVVAAVVAVVYLTSDIRATTLDAGPVEAAPDAPVVVPSSLTQAWSLTTDPDLGAVASPYGVVVTADEHTVTGSDAITGAQRWAFSRDNVPLCALGSGDTDARGVTTRGKVRGVVTVFEKGGSCSQVRLLDPVTGDRHYDRSSPNQVGGALAFGGPYAAWMGPDLLELWRDDLVRTIQYGDQPQPTKANTLHTGCLFSDIALADTQFATIEHCAATGGGARLVINWATPDSAPDKPDGQDVFQHAPRADIDTGSPAARIVGITPDRVAVVVSAPEPAMVVYDATGAETSRTPVDISAQDIQDADVVPTAPGAQNPVPVSITPSVQADDVRYSLIGTTLLSVSQNQIQVPAPVTSTPTSAAPSATGSIGAGSLPSGAFGSLAGVSLGGATSTAGSAVSDSTDGSEPPATVSARDLTLRWTTGQVRGLPALVGDAVLVPVDAGLAVLADVAGTPRVVPGTADTTVLPVDRAGWTGRVDAAAVGTVVVETRGGTVVGLS